MRQLRPANGIVCRTGTAGKQAQLGPARELRGSIEHRGTSSASSAFCTNSRPLWAPAPPGKKHSLRREALSSHLSPAQRKEIFNGWSEGPFQVEGGGGERVWEVCPNGPADHSPIIPAMPRATGLSCGNARIGHGTRRVAAVSQQLACCGRIPAHGCSCRLRAGRCCCHRRCGCGHQGREREPIRGDYMSLGSDSLGLQAWLCRLSCKARRIGHSEMVDHEYVVFVCSGRRPDYIGTKPGWSTIREDWFLNGW